MEKIQDSYDLVIVGAGTSGTTAARFAAEFGLDVCLIDTLEKGSIGNKVCGDGLVASIFERLGIRPPHGEELLSVKPTVKFYSPDQSTYITINLKVFMVDRLKLGQRLLEEVLQAGVKTFLDETRAIDLLYNDKDYVNGVKVRLANGEKARIQSKIVIDASGYTSPLRRKINSNLILNKISKWDVCILYRENIEFIDEPPLEFENSTIIIDQDNIPGGYVWYFPKSKNVINMGLGTFMEERKNLQFYFQKYCKDRWVKDSEVKILSSAGGPIPIRRPIPSSVEDGILFVGDAACHVNPSNGGGVDTGMLAARYAAQIAKKAIQSGDYSLTQLWEYNYKLMRDFGKAHAASDIVRIFLQYSKSEDFNFIMRKKLMTGEDVTNIWKFGKFDLSLTKKIKQLFKGLSRIGLLLKLNKLVNSMKRIYKHYENYPKNPKSFKEWKTKENEIFYEFAEDYTDKYEPLKVH